jgi:hypothetical protein
MPRAGTIQGAAAACTHKQRIAMPLLLLLLLLPLCCSHWL